MIKKLLLLLIFVAITSCGSSRVGKSAIQLKFLDDYIIPADETFENTKVGGLSGIDFNDGKYYFICDDSGNPRFYTAEISLAQNKIDSVQIKKMTKIIKKGSALENSVLDMESIRKVPNSENFIVSSEGLIKSGKDPAVFILDSNGEIINTWEIPDYYSASGKQHPRSNGVFEGLALGIDSSYWAGTELPLQKDGSRPKLLFSHSPVRITKFDKQGIPESQFTMYLGNITKIPWLYFAVNGLTELLEYAPNKFLVLERGFVAGHGSNGNTVKVFEVDASNTTNTLAIKSLKKHKFISANKKLILNFKWIKEDLKEEIIDNIEGMTFGPVLANGNKTLLFISDNNFNNLGKQITQLILMEIKIP